MNNELILNMPVELTKSNARANAEQIIARVADGFANPLEVMAGLEFIAEVAKQAKDAIKAYALTEAEKYESKSFGAFGVQWQVKETGVKYDYTGSQRWRELQETIELARAEQKGEEVTMQLAKTAPKTSTTSVICTLNK